MRRVAFFDVDETLLAGKSMVSFWRHWSAQLAGEGRSPGELRTSGADRAALNRAYFAHFEGVHRTVLEESARRWYADYRRGPRAFLPATLRRLSEHRAYGDEIALVTGSGQLLVRPVADDLGAHHVLATEQMTDAGGTLTGEVRRSLIGDAKREAVTALLERLGVRAEDCHAYGDHSTDLAMLGAVGHPVVVGDDPVLTGHGRARGWEFLENVAGPRGAAVEVMPVG
ncbi:HAD-IB family hydrolase [Streptomyces sp. NPDC046939]|uniref:HAD family hydrolase n=1 Tax=Streptomyces sp. NPDC046939 TaxID=3155376 RepID=UPI0033FC8A2F